MWHGIETLTACWFLVESFSSQPAVTWFCIDPATGQQTCCQDFDGGEYLYDSFVTPEAGAEGLFHHSLATIRGYYAERK